MPKACKTVSLAEMRLGYLFIGGNSGSRDVDYPIPRVGLLGERPAVSGGREKTQREELQCQVMSDTAEGAVVKTMRVLLVPSLRERDDHLTARLRPLCVIDKGMNEVHRRMEVSRGHGHQEFHLDCAYMERATEDRESPILVGK